MKIIQAPPASNKPLTELDVRKAIERGRMRKHMRLYTFTLRCRLPTDDADPGTFVDALATAGCTDATIGIGQKGRIAVAFARASSSYSDAVSSAIGEVTAAIPGVRQIDVIAETDP